MQVRGVFISTKLDSVNPGKSKVNLEEAISSIQSGKKAKFDETLEVCVNLDGGKKEIAVRGSIEAPAGLGDRKLIFAVFCDEKLDNVDYFGGEDLIQKFLSGEIKKCDVCICTRKYVPLVSSKIAKILGRRKIMPDARFGTVVDDSLGEINRVVESFKRGRMNFRSNKNVVHGIFGKVSFGVSELVQNFNTLMREIKALLPEKSSISSVYIAPTMGKSLEVKVGSI